MLYTAVRLRGDDVRSVYSAYNIRYGIFYRILLYLVIYRSHSPTLLHPLPPIQTPRARRPLLQTALGSCRALLATWLGVRCWRQPARAITRAACKGASTTIRRHLIQPLLGVIRLQLLGSCYHRTFAKEKNLRALVGGTTRTSVKL